MTMLRRALVAAQERPLWTMLLGGAALFATSRGPWFDPLPTPIPITVEVAPGADEAAIERATEEAMLLAFAERAGFVGRDPAIRARLEMNVRFVDPSLRGDAAIDEAVRLGMHRSDPVVRARMRWLASETLARATRREPTDEELRRYLEAHREIFARPATLTFEQVFVSRQRAAFEERVRQVAAAPTAHASDPSLLPARMTDASPRRIDARFGRGFAERLGSLPIDDTYRRVDSSFGAHFVRVRSRTEGRLPPLEEVRARVRVEWEHDDRPRRIRAALRRMRAAYRVEVQRS